MTLEVYIHYIRRLCRASPRACRQPKMRRRPTSIPLLALLLPATQVRGLAGAPRRPPGGGGGGGGGGRRRTAVRPSSGRYGGGGGYSPRNDGYARDGYSRDARDGGWGEDAPPRPAVYDSELGGEFVYGVSPVLAAMRRERRAMHRLLLQESMDMGKRKDAAAIDQAVELADRLDLPVVRTDKGTLNGLTANRPHQGIVLHASALEFEALDAPPAISAPGALPRVWLALDEVTDPQNFGALLRSAFFLGVEIVVSAKNSAPLSGVVSKASAGAMELAEVHAVRNLPRFLEEAAEDGWQVVGAALEGSVTPAEVAVDRDTILVLGSEGHGLRTNVRPRNYCAQFSANKFLRAIFRRRARPLQVLRACTSLVRVPSAAASDDPDAALVDSLNVSVAGGVLLYALLAQRKLDV